MGIPAVSVQAAGVKTPGKVNITSVKMTGNNKVTINWKKASNATKYRIYYKQSGARSWKAIADVSSGKTSYTHTSNSRNPLAGGKKYVYTVRAYNKTSRKWGTYDKNGKGVTVPIVPGKVKLVSVKANEHNKVTVTWNKVSDWKNMVAYIKTSYEPGMYLEHRVEIYNQLQAGTFPVSVYYKNTLLRTCQVTVTGADSKVVKYRKWMNELEQKAWTSGMTVMEKLTAIKKYIYDNYTYTTDGVMCNAGAQALLYAARDLGLTARYRFVGPQYDYEKGYGDVYYHFGSAFCGGHVCTIITMYGKDYIMETQGHEG